MFSSKNYWENRYKQGGNSGSGSYNNLALFKADIINDFIQKNNINTIIDYGVGDGNQLKLINTENKIYTGIDVSKTVIQKCKNIYSEDKTKLFLHVDDIYSNLYSDLVLSCDVIYHLVEDEIYKEYMQKLFNMSNKYVIIYAKNEDINHAQHVKFRKFSNYIEQNLPNWNLIKHIPNKYPQLKLGQNNDNTSPSDFYIYKIQDEYFKNLENNWKIYIQENMIPIIKNLNVLLEGNIYSAHNTFNESDQLSDKRVNIYNLINNIKPKKVLEIGFNAGFSTLFMKMINSDLAITCIDLNEHKYVVPCFNKLNSDFNGLSIILESSYDIALPKLILNKEEFDLIHIDGDHRIDGARKDFELSLKLSKNGTVIIFDDTNLPHLNNLCNYYVKKGLVSDYELTDFLNNQKYKHRILKVNK
jgi:predicted O-methyltransferase YrrM